MVSVEVVGQLVDSMSEAVSQLDEAVRGKNYDKANELRVFIFDLYSKLDGFLGGKNV